MSSLTKMDLSRTSAGANASPKLRQAQVASGHSSVIRMNGALMMAGTFSIMRTFDMNQMAFAASAGRMSASIGNLVLLPRRSAFRSLPSMSPTLPMKR